ncbi:hypothetical protein Goklo_022543 [Gossypium klotzschianum]|uniref:Serine-threonine/tyrosine-protein kinase catalytic domain-containing protein n=1 Tax=Gossypium klotzschianum TaxID=34286 RepID=A0A7J8TN00_9ROSI|nr:hypothetical protein [Gossypium klotzschianum]
MERRKASPFPDQLCKYFTLAEIQAATNNFNHAFVIGSNKFEIQLIFQLRYVTLVFLIAIATNNEKIIVYEYMTNGTLRDHLYNTKKKLFSPRNRDWKFVSTDSGFKIRIFADQFSQLGTKHIWNESIDESIDPFLKGKISLNCLRTYAKIVENCIRENGCQRLSMYDVARKLEFVLQLQEIEDAEQIGQVSDEAQSQVNQDH